MYELITWFPSAMIRSKKINFIEKIFSQLIYIIRTWKSSSNTRNNDR